MTNTDKKVITKQEALDNIRELGKVFVSAMLTIGKEPKATSDLMNGFVAYDVLNLKGQWDYMDESVDIVMNAVYEAAIEMVENDKTLKEERT